MSISQGMEPQRPRILLVDDDETLREVLKTSLEDAGYLVSAAQSGKAAQQILSLKDFDLVLSDIRMPDGNGLELMRHVKRTKPIPVVLMTGFSEILETQEAYELGANDFISKPFKKEELVALLKKCLQQPKSGTPEHDLDEEFCRVSIDDFLQGHGAKCDIYVRLSAVKYVKVAEGKKDIPLDIIKALSAKNVKFLHILREDYRKYVGFNYTLTDALKATTKTAKDNKLRFVNLTHQILEESLSNTGISRDSLDSARSIVETTVSILADDAKLVELFSSLIAHADFVYSHSVGVAFYGILIAQQLGWNTSVNRFKITLGGLLHDVGKKEIDISTLKKGHSQCQGEEMKLYESHTIRGGALVAKLSSIPEDILQICNQHHETCNGTGYPEHLKKVHIHPLARLISVANEFCNLALKSPSHPGMPPGEALVRLKNLQHNTLDEIFVGALDSLFRGIKAAHGS